jgi:hypothetical protein
MKVLWLRLTSSQTLDTYSAAIASTTAKQGITSAPTSSEFMAPISTSENNNQNFADDDKWEGFKSDDEAEPNEREGHKPDNETEHSVWEDINSETDISGDSNSHGSGASPRSRVLLEKKDGTLVDLNDNLDPDSHLSILSNLIRQVDEPQSSVNRSIYQYAKFAQKIGAKTVQEQILRRLGKDLQRLIETRSLNFDTIKSCEKFKARSSHRPSVYTHVVYDPLTLITVGCISDHPFVLVLGSRSILRT